MLHWTVYKYRTVTAFVDKDDDSILRGVYPGLLLGEL